MRGKIGDLETNCGMRLHHFPSIKDELGDTRPDFAGADADDHGFWGFVFEGSMEGLLASGGLGFGMEIVRTFFCATAGHCIGLLGSEVLVAMWMCVVRAWDLVLKKNKLIESCKSWQGTKNLIGFLYGN